MYDLDTDPYEEVDVYNDYPMVAQHLEQRLSQWGWASVDPAEIDTTDQTDKWSDEYCVGNDHGDASWNSVAVPWTGDNLKSSTAAWAESTSVNEDGGVTTTYTQSFNTDDDEDDYEPPHIIFILTDDFGYNDQGYRGQDCYTYDGMDYGDIDSVCAFSLWQTPTADRLSGEGVRLLNMVVAWVCAPARSSLMTGRYPLRYGLQVAPTLVDLHTTESTIADEMRTAGYKTQMIGKWHLGFTEWSMTPNFRGFENWYGYYSGYVGYFNKTYGNGGTVLDLTNNTNYVCNKYESREQYMGHMLQDKVEESLSYHVNTYGKDTPLFLYYAPELIHDPFEAPQYYIDMCHWGKKPTSTYVNPDQEDWQIYCAMKIIFDEVLANTTCKLESLDMFNTLLIVTTDNGGKKSLSGNNYPHYGSKGTLQGGGTTAGMAFVYGLALPEAARGTNYTGQIHLTDWLPTLMHAATNGEWKQPLSGLEIDGHDQWIAITNGSDHPSPRNETLINLDNVTNKESSIIWKDPETGKTFKYLEGESYKRYTCDTINKCNFVSSEAESNTDYSAKFDVNYSCIDPDIIVPAPSPVPTVTFIPTTPYPTPSPTLTFKPTTPSPTGTPTEPKDYPDVKVL